MKLNVPDELRINVDHVKEIICGSIVDYLTKAGYTKAVLGLSGGIDSACVCYLAAEALGPQNVLALTLPYATSAPESLQDALTVISTLGVQHEHIEITPMMEALFATLPDMDRRRRGNAMARMRMIIWYDRSEAFNGLVLGAANKTEWLLGYSTLHGDSACAMAPIADLYKTQVRQLAAALSVPEQIQRKAPSADLWPGQTDEAELGLTYELADQILYLLLDSGLHPKQVVQHGYPETQVRRVCRLVKHSQFKRTLPAVPKVSEHACTPIPTGHQFDLWADW